MLRNCPKLILILCSVIGLGSVAVAEQGGRGGPEPGKPAAHAANGNGNAGTAGPAGPKVGQTVDGGRLHRVSRPGLYGMSQPPAGSAYGIVNDRLIRFDPESGRILSIIRQVDRILD